MPTTETLSREDLEMAVVHAAEHYGEPPHIQAAALWPAAEKAAINLLLGEPAYITLSMGSCHCGDALAHLTIRHDPITGDIVMVEVTGREAWQQFKGYALDCQIGYGLGHAICYAAWLFHELR